MIFLGIEFDTMRLECHIPSSKLEEIKSSLIIMWIQKKSATKAELQSIIGLLQFVTKCVRPGRI